MCTAILIEDAKVPKRATADIIVYKVGNRIKENEFLSPYQYYIYIPNKLEKANMKFTFSVGFADNTEHRYILDNGGLQAFVYIKQGFHSFTSVNRGHEHIMNNMNNGDVVGEFIIPKGSKYYENGCGNIVSNKIIFKRFIQ